MEFELFFHGTPKGQDIYGKKEDRTYLGTFYDSSTDAIKFLIHARNTDGGRYCYYNYLVYKNVIDSDGRTGGYFGMTLRIDAYCKDFASMYRILDYAYNAFLLGRILKNDGGHLKYAVLSFLDASEVLKKTEAFVLQMIQNAFTSSDFIPLDATFSGNDANTPKFNLYEVTDTTFLEYVRKFGKVAMSPLYPKSAEIKLEKEYQAKTAEMQQQFQTQVQTIKQTSAESERRKENECQSRISQMRHDFENRISQLEQEVKALQTENGDKARQILELDRQVTQHQTKAREYEQRLRNSAQMRNIQQLIEPIKSPLNELSKALDSLSPKTPKRPDNRQGQSSQQLGTWEKIKKYLQSIHLLLTLLVLILVIPLSLKACDKNDSIDAKLDSLDKKIETLQQLQKLPVPNVTEEQVQEKTENPEKKDDELPNIPQTENNSSETNTTD